MKNLGSFLFLLISIGFSAMMIVMSFYRAFEAAGLKACIAEMNDSMDKIETENRHLSLQIENSIGLHKLDRYARDCLGMRPVSAEQIYFIDIVE